MNDHHTARHELHRAPLGVAARRELPLRIQQEIRNAKGFIWLGASLLTTALASPFVVDVAVGVFDPLHGTSDQEHGVVRFVAVACGIGGIAALSHGIGELRDIGDEVRTRARRGVGHHRP